MYSRNIKFQPIVQALFSFLILFMLSSCAQKAPQIKPYENENIEVLTALEYENDNQFKQAAQLYEELEIHTNNFEYLQKTISLRLHVKEYKKAQTLASYATDKYPNKHKLLFKLQSYIYLAQGKLDESLEITLKAIQKFPDDFEYYDLAGTLYYQKKEYTKAKDYFESAYTKNKNVDSLLNLSNILYTYLNKKVDALSYLETHNRLYKFSPKVYAKLINIYAESKDYNALADTYNSMYQETGKEYYAQKVIEIYYQTNQKDKAIQYLKSNKINDMLLLGLYKEKKDYIKAAKLARKIYTRTKDYDMLAQIAMLEYEVLLQKRIKNKKKNKKKLRNIIANLKLALKKKANPSYYNYLGYIMIDNAMGTKQGIRYVQHALKKEPDNPYYLDSLAWGHYKLGECKKAKKIMKTVIEKLGTKDEEVRYHLKMLEQCKEQKYRK